MATRRPQDLVFTLFGDFLLQRPEAVWVGSLIALLEPLGLSGGGVRTVLSRMVSKGWLQTERRGRNSFYSLTAKGRRLLEEGKARIYDPPRKRPWDGSWYLVAYSIPEERRHLRDRLRTQLSWMGCGSLGNGLRICPHDVRRQVEELATSLDVREHVDAFRAEHIGFRSAHELVDRCWNLPVVNARYESFVENHLPEYERCREQGVTGSLEPRACYVQRFALVHEYRDFPLLDPYLPGPLQPQDWAGECAAALFNALHDLLMPPADRYVDAAIDLAAKPSGAEASEAYKQASTA